MANDITGDSQRTKHKLSPQGEDNFEAIFGKRDYRNRPILQEPTAAGDSTQQGPLPRHCNCYDCLGLGNCNH